MTKTNPDTIKESKKQEIIDTLIDDIIDDGRAKGNTTRQTNLAIEILFQEGQVKVLDHYENGENNRANKELYRRVIQRLRTEHTHVIGRVAQDKKNSVIKLMGH